MRIALALLPVLLLTACVTRRPAPAPAPAAPAAPMAAMETSPAPPASDTAGGILVVEARGLQSSSGRVAFALFDSQGGFAGDRPVRAEYVPAAAGSVTWRVEGLAPGTYAIKAYHDRNGNGRLDTGAFGAPVEPYGFSNDARGTFGPPPFTAATFTLPAAGTTVTFTVR